MGKFKEYLLESQLGLGNLGGQLQKAMDHVSEKLGGAYLTSDVSGSGMPNIFSNIKLPGTDLKLPKVERTGVIQTLLLTKNPIYLRLSDGTEAHLSYDQYKRIQGEPAVGKTITLIFQRDPESRSNIPSKIEKAIVR